MLSLNVDESRIEIMQYKSRDTTKKRGKKLGAIKKHLRTLRKKRKGMCMKLEPIFFKFEPKLNLKAHFLRFNIF